MPRYARFHVTGGLFHVISRFHDRRFYLDIEGARERYLELLGRAAETHDSRIIAYCLMSSHVHLVLQLGNDPLARLTKQINAPFGNWINKQTKGLGQIFADRPKSVLVHSETHGMALLRYVHNNPVRAGLVSRASDSDWSSHRAYLGLASCPSWLATEAVFGNNHDDEETLRRDLACFVDEGRMEERRPEFSGEVSKALGRRIRRMMGSDVELSYPVLGPDEFVLSSLKEHVHQHGDRQVSKSKGVSAEQVIKAVFKSLSLEPGLARSKTKTTPVSRGRALSAWLWVERMGRPQIVMADALNLSPEAVTMMLSRLRRKGLTLGEKQRLTRIFNKLTEGQGSDTTVPEKRKLSKEPKVIILKRQRK
jgi:putative transposase